MTYLNLVNSDTTKSHTWAIDVDQTLLKLENEFPQCLQLACVHYENLAIQMLWRKNPRLKPWAFMKMMKFLLACRIIINISFGSRIMKVGSAYLSCPFFETTSLEYIYNFLTAFKA